ncbi:MAG: YihY/virulence factor BrkB family protein [Bryobacteraceae bacterium]
MLGSFKRMGSILVQTLEKCQRDNTPLLAAGLSFYAMLSLAPALWIVLAMAGAFIGRDYANGAVLHWMTQHLGPNAAEYLAGIVAQVNESSRLATIGGAAAVFLAATAAFGALQDSLNRVWHQPEPPDNGLLDALRGFTRGFLTRRFWAFVLMLLMGVLLLASLISSAVLTFVSQHLDMELPAPRFLLEAADFVFSVLLTLLLFGTIYHMLHRKAFGKKSIWTGAAVTAVLFAVGKTLIGFYLGSAGVRSAYGAAGSFVLLLLWIYYSAQILLFGAEFTEVYSRQQDREAGR